MNNDLTESRDVGKGLVCQIREFRKERARGRLKPNKEALAADIHLEPPA
jgi:hypothetical protein